MLLFLLKANIALTLFYLAYHFGLRRLTFYTLNRIFLLMGIVVAAVCPFIDPDTLFRQHQSLQGVAYVIDLNALNQRPATPFINILLFNIFWAGVVLMSIRLLFQLISLWRLHRATRKGTINEQQVRISEKSLQPFSFLRFIYINPSLHTPAELSSIMQHEQVHVKQWHTVDVLLGELNKIFYWFNPGAWLMSIAIRENLEFITDRYMLRQGTDVKAYQYSLIKVSGVPYATAIANNFNFSHLKQRIMMMNKKQSSKYNLVRYFVLGAIVLIVLVSLNYSRAASTEAKKALVIVSENKDTTIKVPIRVVYRTVNAADTILPARSVDTVLATVSVDTVPPPPPPPSPKEPKIVPDPAPAPAPAPAPVIVPDRAGKPVPPPPPPPPQLPPPPPPGVPGKAVTTIVTDQRGSGSKTTTFTTSTDVKTENDNITTTTTGIRVRTAQFTGSPITVSFRTLTDSCKPIIVVNGKVTTSVGLSGLKPDTIKSVTVLKGESAIKLYGSGAVNGVVEVTTK